MKRTLFIAASIALASVASADKGDSVPLMAASAAGTPAPGSGNAAAATIVDSTYNPTNGTTTMIVDIAGDQSWDGLSDPSNTVLMVPLGTGASMTGIGWDVNCTTVGGSWLSEARFYFDGSDQDLSGLFLTPGIADATAGSGSYSSGGVLDLSDNGIPDIPILADGNLHIELNESFDDVADAVDADWTAGSTLTIEFEGGAAGVPTVSQWGLIIMTVMLLLGVVVMSLKSKRQPVSA